MTLRNRERGMRMLRRIIDRCDTKEQRKRNENVVADHRCDTKEQRKRNENVEVDQWCGTKEQRERGMRMLRRNKGVTLRNREREE